MELVFANREFRDMCLNDTVMKQQLDVALAEKLKSRLADMVAAETVSDLLAGNPRELEGERSDQMSVLLLKSDQLVFRSGHEKSQTLDSGKIDWSRVSRIFILGIEQL